MINIDNFLKLIDNMTVLELNEVLKVMEQKYKINSNFINRDEKINREIKKENFSVLISSVGSNKISVIKLLREILNLGLKEAKDLIDSCPVIIKENIDDISLAESIKEKFENVGAKIEVKKI